MTEQSNDQPTAGDWAKAVGQVEATMNLLEGSTMLRQATGAYRDKLVNEEGFSEELAAAMASHFHMAMMAMFQAKIVGEAQTVAAAAIAKAAAGSPKKGWR